MVSEWYGKTPEPCSQIFGETPERWCAMALTSHLFFKVSCSTVVCFYEEVVAMDGLVELTLRSATRGCGEKNVCLWARLLHNKNVPLYYVLALVPHVSIFRFLGSACLYFDGRTFMISGPTSLIWGLPTSYAFWPLWRNYTNHPVWIGNVVFFSKLDVELIFIWV